MAVGSHAATFSRSFPAARGISARALAFDPPVVVAAYSDRALRIWRGGAAGPQVLAPRFDDESGYAVSASAGTVALIQGGQDPLLVPGTTVDAQWWSRDPLDPTGFGTGLSDALEFTIAP